MADVSRRAVLKSAAALGGVTAVANWWHGGTFAGAAVQAGSSPYGPLMSPDVNGIRLPTGFSSRIVARTGQLVGNTSYRWHAAPDGGACFGKSDGGWVYVSNSEVSAAGGGGASAVSFGPDGTINGAYRILANTTRNCAGGATSWATWLSCEENGAGGLVYECNPYGGAAGVARPALGRFNHEAAALDRTTGHIFLTEDDPNGRLYRFVPTTPGNLSSGTLTAAKVAGSAVTWVPTSTAGPDRQSTTTAFNGGEGAWVHRNVLYFTTKGDDRIWALDIAAQTISVFYDRAATPGAALGGVDNICAHNRSNDLYIAEDGDNMEICVIAAIDGQPTVAPFLRVDGQSASELCGPAFNSAGTHLYFSSQRGTDGTGITYEVTGPFRSAPVDTLAPLPPPGVAATASGADVTVTWQAATDLPNPGGVGVASYWVVRDWTTQWLVPANGPLQYVDRGVSVGTHRYQVFAVDAGSRISVGSTAATVVVGGAPDTEAPNPPPGVTATLEGAAVRVRWQAATDLPDPGGVGVASYWVVRDWTTQWLVPADGPLEYLDATSPAGARRYEVHAVDRNNRISGPSVAAVVTVP